MNEQPGFRRSQTAATFPSEERIDEQFLPAPAPKPSTNLNGSQARKAFDDLRRLSRARESERHADRGVRMPVRRYGGRQPTASAGGEAMSGR